MAGQKKKDVALTPFGRPADYAEFLESLKSRVQQAQTKAMLSVNRELIRLYWDIGRLIVPLARQRASSSSRGTRGRSASIFALRASASSARRFR